MEANPENFFRTKKAPTIYGTTNQEKIHVTQEKM